MTDRDASANYWARVSGADVRPLAFPGPVPPMTVYEWFVDDTELDPSYMTFTYCEVFKETFWRITYNALDAIRQSIGTTSADYTPLTFTKFETSPHDPAVLA